MWRLLFLLLLCSCSNNNTNIPQLRPTTTTPSGIGVVVPLWLSARSPTKTAEALLEIDTETIPPGWIVVIEPPVFVTNYRDTRNPQEAILPGLVRGYTDFTSMEIHVGWRASCEPETPYLPALSWEAKNARQDPGHEDPFRNE